MPAPTVYVRTATPDDAVVAAAIRAAASPYVVMTAAGLRSRMTDDETDHSWLATVGDEPAGFATCRHPQQGRSRLMLSVSPPLRRLGVGSALLAAVEEHVGADRALLGIADDEAGVSFATRHGCDIGRRHRFAAADTAQAPDPVEPPPGVEVRRLADLDPRAIWALTQATGPDDPSGMSVPQPYETWRAEDWDFPDNAAALSAGALVDGTLVAMTHVFADLDRGRSWSAWTGVHPESRGRGLARLVKSWSMRWSRDAGITLALTANDAANAPMLAVNAWLGYREVAAATSISRPARGAAAAG